MSTLFNNNQNKTDVIFRNIIIGVLHAIDDRIYWNNTINGEHQKVEVPAYFTVAGSERFLSDIFLNSDELKDEQKIANLYNKYPRAHIDLSSISLQEEYLTNKYKRANYLREEGGEVKTYNAEFNELPFKLNFDVTIFLDSIVDIFKCIENVFQNLYKNIYFRVDVGSTNIPCDFNIPADLEKSRTIDFGLSDKKEVNVTFNIEVNATYPMFKDARGDQFDTSMFAGNIMENVKQNVYIIKNVDNTDSIGRKVEVEKTIWPTGNNSGFEYEEKD